MRFLLLTICPIGHECDIEPKSQQLQVVPDEVNVSVELLFGSVFEDFSLLIQIKASDNKTRSPGAVGFEATMLGSCGFCAHL